MVVVLAVPPSPIIWRPAIVEPSRCHRHSLKRSGPRRCRARRPSSSARCRVQRRADRRTARIDVLLGAASDDVTGRRSADVLLAAGAEGAVAGGAEYVVGHAGVT